MKSFVVVVAALALAAALAPAALAAAGPLRIAYSGQGSTAWGACTMNPDGSNNVCLSDGYRPIVAPGGSYIWFQDLRDHDTTNYRAIYRMRADGSDTQMVVFNPFSFGPVSVDPSADGTKIVSTAMTGTACSPLRRSTSRTPTGPASGS